MHMKMNMVLIILDQTQPFYIMMENLLQDFIMNYFLMEI